MARRSRDWNEDLAEDLQDPKFAREFWTAAVDDGVPLKVTLAKVIRATGVKRVFGKRRHAWLQRASRDSSQEQPNARNTRTPPEAVRITDRPRRGEAPPEGTCRVTTPLELRLLLALCVTEATHPWMARKPRLE